jgi:ATP-dependent RNA circularization protein (DNA/RNA ligase family)
MSGFFRFPHTPHLAWLGDGRPRGDKVLSPHAAAALLAGPVVVEEKVDGANLGFSVTPEGDLLCQNRGAYLTPDTSHRQFRPLWPWLAPRREALIDALWPNLILFGEWCVAVHSVHYDRLPDWFLGFDVYDREAEMFWDTGRRNVLFAELGLSSVPQVSSGATTLPQLLDVLGPSSLGGAPMEGLVVRRDTDDSLTSRAKLVRATFTQAIETHWSRGPFRRNALASGAPSWR